MKSLKQILREASGGKEAYQKFFNSLLKKFGVSSPSELEGDAKKKFYDAIDKGWDGDNEKPEKNEARRPKMVQGDKDEYYKRVDKVNQKYGIGPGHKQGLGDLSKAQQNKYFADVDKALGHTTERHNDPEGLDPETTVDSDEDLADKAASQVETYDDPDDLDPETTLNPDEDTTNESELISEIFSRAQMKKAIGIARKSKGQYTKAYNAIEKIKKGLGDEHIVQNALKRANESIEK